MIAVGKRFLFILLLWGGMIVPIYSMGQEINGEGWPIPDLKGLLPYSITIKRIEGVEKVVEKFHTPNGGHVARISGNGKVFAYAVDSDQDPPIDYLLLDPDGYGKFTHKWMAEESYSIPDWISN
jgi:hypothetical protein